MFQRIVKSNSLQSVFKRCLHIKETNVGVLGVPFDKGQKMSGVDLGPQSLRDAGLVEKLKSLRKSLEYN